MSQTIQEAAQAMYDAHEPDRMGPAFLDWLADRLVNVYREDPNTDFVQAVRRRAMKARAALALVAPEVPILNDDESADPYSDNYIGHNKARQLGLAKCICVTDAGLRDIMCPFHGR